MSDPTPEPCGCYAATHNPDKMARALAAAQKAIRGLLVITDEHEAERQQLAAQNADLLAALEPETCLTCGKIHVERLVDEHRGKPMYSWADQTDGHPRKRRVDWPREWAEQARAAIAKAKGEVSVDE